MKRPIVLKTKPKNQLNYIQSPCKAGIVFFCVFHKGPGPSTSSLVSPFRTPRPRALVRYPTQNTLPARLVEAPFPLLRALSCLSHCGRNRLIPCLLLRCPVSFFVSMGQGSSAPLTATPLEGKRSLRKKLHGETSSTQECLQCAPERASSHLSRHVYSVVKGSPHRSPPPLPSAHPGPS